MTPHIGSTRPRRHRRATSALANRTGLAGTARTFRVGGYEMTDEVMQLDLTELFEKFPASRLNAIDNDTLYLRVSVALRFYKPRRENRSR